MSLKPVWIILVAQVDLVELAGRSLASQFTDYTVQPNSDQFGLIKNNRAQLFLNSGDPLSDFEKKEREQLAAWGLTGYAHSVESTDPHLTKELISRLSRLTDMAVDDDMGNLLHVRDFLDLKPEQQVSFLIGNGT